LLSWRCNCFHQHGYHVIAIQYRPWIQSQRPFILYRTMDKCLTSDLVIDIYIYIYIFPHLCIFCWWKILKSIYFHYVHPNAIHSVYNNIIHPIYKISLYIFHQISNSSKFHLVSYHSSVINPRLNQETTHKIPCVSGRLYMFSPWVSFFFVSGKIPYVLSDTLGIIGNFNKIPCLELRISSWWPFLELCR
jgi:hypothetical protein